MTATLNVFGDTLRVEWTGSVWVAPCCGAQFARRTDAMRCELEYYLSASGENVEEMSDEIDDMLVGIEGEE